MRSWIVIALAVDLFIACSAVIYLFSTVASNCQEAFNSGIFERISWIINLLFFSGTVGDSRHSNISKTGRCKVKGNDNESGLSLFKGREAKLNRAILIVLLQCGPLVIYDITKEIKKRKRVRGVKYTNVNRRVRALVEQGYLESVGSRETQSGVQGTLYSPTIRAKVAFYLNQISPDQFVKEANDEALTTELAALALFLAKDQC
jgi:hypothetical protein